MGTYFSDMGISLNNLGAKLSRLAHTESPVSRYLLRSTIYSVETKEKAIALTFDDGPSAHSLELMDVLEAHQAHATFFVVGGKVEKNKELVELMHNRGFELANHTWTHARFNAISIMEMLHEISRTADLLQELTGDRPRFMRPTGHITTDFRNVLIYFLTKHKVVHDTFAPPDFQADCPVELIRDALVEVSAPGSIVCLHDMHRHTIQALAEALPRLKDKGYRFLTLSEMEGIGRLSPQRGVLVPKRYREY